MSTARAYRHRCDPVVVPLQYTSGAVRRIVARLRAVGLEARVERHWGKQGVFVVVSQDGQMLLPAATESELVAFEVALFEVRGGPTSMVTASRVFVG